MPDNHDSRALYLRWRPQTFSEVVGQEHVTRTLRNAVLSGRLAHAYLLCGPRGTGKTSLARILYRAANCTEPRDGDPCGECPTCAAGRTGRALDLVEVDAASNRGIDDIRQLRERVAYAPSEGRYRVYIIDEAHELTTPAWDAFLKTLEEPPPHTIFVLATTEAHKVPATIVSRCQRFDLRRIGLAAIRAQLARVAEEEALQVDAAVLDCLARMARGGLRDALSLMDQLRAYAGDQMTLPAARALLGMPSLEAVRGFLERLERGDVSGGVEHLAGVLDDGVDVRQFASEVVTHLRGLLLVRRGATAGLGSDFSSDDLEWLDQHAPGWTFGRILALTRDLSDGLARLRDPHQLELHLELAILEGGEAVGRDVAAPDPPPAPNPQQQPAADTQPSAPATPQPAPDAPQQPLTTDQVRSRWPEVMELLRTRNGVVAAMLEAAEVVSAEASELRLAVGYAFHVKQLSDTKNRTVVEEALTDLLGQPLRLSYTFRRREAAPIDEHDLAEEMERLIAEDPVLRRAVDLWGRNLTIVE